VLHIVNINNIEINKCVVYDQYTIMVHSVCLLFNWLNITFLKILLNRTAWLVRKGVAGGRGKGVAVAPSSRVQGAKKRTEK